jgi:putative holliday junction resolvase
MRYLSIDLGDKRTGLAVGDDDSGVISPVEVLVTPRGEALIAAILKSIDQHEPHALVIGLPVNMDGSEGPAAKTVREFGETLRLRCDLPIHFQDERLTSYAADQRMSQTGRTHKQKKHLRDALAAAEILRDYFDGLQRSNADQR